MKITEIRVHPMETRFERQCWTAHEPFDMARLTLVEVRTDEGLIGVGEISVGPQKSVCDMVERLAPAIIGMDPIGHFDVWERMLSTTNPRPGGLGGWDGLPPPLPRHLRYFHMAAMAGIDLALWDIKGKAMDLPVFRVLGGTRTQVYTYSVGGFYSEDQTPDDLAEEFAGYTARGYTAVKLKTGAYAIERELERARAVREAIGPDTLFMLDMNAPYDLEGCVAFARAMEPLDIYWLEEPLHWYLQPADFARLAGMTSIPLAHCEREWHRFTTRDFIDSGGIRFVEFDATRFGGFTEAIRVAEYAAMKGVVVAPHSAPHIHAHLASALGDAAFGAESVGDERIHPIHHRIFRGGAHFHNGQVRLTEDPGFGLDVDWDAVSALRSQS